MTRSATTDRLVGDVLDGRYEVLQRLARGGMATVYRAWDRRLERIVAIKVMHDGLGDDADFIAKFDREARAAARLCDRSVVSIFDQGYDHGRPYIVMEFVEGATLRSVITRDAPLSPLRALQMIEPVAAALATAHDSGLVHRDVKPENVLISDRGAIKVADFGLARTISSQSATATQGLLIGTVSYLPPELLTNGRAHSWSDIYSTGIVLFEMLTGTKPYVGDTPISVAYRHVNEDVPAPSQVLARKNPGQARREPIPDYVDALVLACTRRNPQLRPADGRELLRRIRRVRRALEQGIRSDDALCALVFPASALPWSAEATEALSPDSVATSVLAAGATETAQQPSPPPEVLATNPNLTPVRPVPARPAAAPRPQPVRPVSPAPPRIQNELSPQEEMPMPARERFPNLSRSTTHRRRRAFVVTLLIVLLTLSVGLTSWWFAAGRYTTTPSVVNHSRAEAEAIASANNMPISFTEQYSETVPKDLIISSVPAPGERVLRDTEIAAVVSLGPERFAVPQLIGLKLDEAKAALTSANLAAGAVTEQWSDTVATGLVVAAGYTEGELLKRDTTVDLTVSKGREPLTIPNVVGLAKADATKALTDAGFKIETGPEQASSTVPLGSVISQQPASGTGYRGDTVTVIISKGATLVTVPTPGRNEKPEDYQKRLEDAKFKAELSYSGPRLPGLGRITRVTDEQGNELTADSQLPEGAKIKVYVSL